MQVTVARPPIHRLAMGTMSAAINKSPATSSSSLSSTTTTSTSSQLKSIASKASNRESQVKSADTKNLSITQIYRKIQLKNGNHENSTGGSRGSGDDTSINSKFNSMTKSSASTIVPLSSGHIIKTVLPSPAAMVAGPALGQENSDANLDHNSLDELYKEPMYFGTENSTTITTQVGANAHLPCVIHHIGEGVVSVAYYALLSFI